MKAIEVALTALLFGLPIWLVARAWRSYLNLNANAVGKSFRMQIGLIFISVSAATWVAVFALMILEDYSIGLTLAQNLSPMVVGLFNILLSIGAFACSGVWQNSGDENKRLKRAIGVASGVLILIWLFIFANPH